MRFLKYSIVTILLLLTPIENIMAVCSDWLAKDDNISPDKPVVIEYYVTLSLKYYDSYLNRYSYSKYPGNTNRRDGTFRFFAPDKPIKLALIGPEDSGKKQFVMPARRKDIKAFFEPRPRKSFDGFFEYQVYGGYFSNKIWKYHPKKREKLRCVKKEDSNVLLSLEEAKNFGSSSGRKKTKLSDLRPNIADVLSSNKPSNPPSSLIDIASSINKKNLASSPDLSEDEIKSEVIICNNELKKLPHSLPNVRSPVTVSGLLKKIKTQAYWFDPSIDSSPQKQQFDFELFSMTYKFVVVEIPYGKDKITQIPDKKSKSAKIFPVRFSGIADVQKVPAKMPTLISKDNMNILVVGDASSIAISGLEQMEKILIEKSNRKFSWTIDWRNVSANGKWQTSKKLGSFIQLIKKTKSVGKKKVLLTADSHFINFINDFENTILNAEKQFDFVIWVKDSYEVPLKTPDLMWQLIKKIHDNGKIPRFPNGKPHTWLYIISGNMPGESMALLNAAITRATPRPGYVKEEKTVRTPRRLLNRPESLALSLKMVGMRHVKPLPAEFDVDPDTLAVDANQVFDSLGLLLSAKGIDDLLSSVRNLKNMTVSEATKFFGIYEPTTLLSIQSDSAGEPKQLVVKDKQFAARSIRRRQKSHKNRIDKFLNQATKVLKTVKSKLGTDSRRCTHIYLKDTEMDLNWLDK
jgi:hypothetical protein